MITKFKIFENINVPPKVGDYVIINPNGYEHSWKAFRDFILVNVGQIIDIKIQHGGTELYYDVKFENINEDLMKTAFYGDGTRRFHLDNIKCWSENKTELEALLNSQKYNL